MIDIDNVSSYKPFKSCSEEEWMKSLRLESISYLLSQQLLSPASPQNQLSAADDLHNSTAVSSLWLVCQCLDLQNGELWLVDGARRRIFNNKTTHSHDLNSYMLPQKIVHNKIKISLWILNLWDSFIDMNLLILTTGDLFLSYEVK